MPCSTASFAVVTMVALRLLSVLAVVFVVVNAQGNVAEKDDFEYPDLAEDFPDDAYHNYDDSNFYYYTPFDVGNLTLRKCFCDVNQIWDGSGCHEQWTVVGVLGTQGPFAPFAANSSSFGNATIGAVNCSSGMLHFTLSTNYATPDQFFILDTGHLDWKEQHFENYCVEHIYGDDGIPDEWFAQVCLEPLEIPRCCPEGHSIENGSCVASQIYQFSPPISISISGRVEEWPPLDKVEIADISCTESEDTFFVEVDTEAVALVYYPLKPHLFWASPAKIRSQELRSDYCIGVKAGSEQEPTYIAKLCYKDSYKDHVEKCSNRTCVRKCCGDFQVPDHSSCKPVSNESEEALFRPIFYHPANLTPGAPEPEDLTIVHGLPLCDEFFQLAPYEEKDDQFYLLSNGYLHAPAFPKPFPPDKYCLDTFIGTDNKAYLLPLVCFHEQDHVSPVCTSVQTYLYPVLLLASVGFLGITLVVYLSVPELHAKVHGKCLVSHVTALLMAYISLFIVQRTTKSLSTVACKFMASVTHISFLAAFFWLNVMCFDIWWTLKSMRPVPETGELSRLRFKLYSLYSWGCPLVIAIVSVIIQSLPEDFDVIRPDFGTTKCWFRENLSLWAYFYGFVLVLVVANIIFFCQVAYILIVAQNDPILQRTRQQNRERMWLYVKLFLVMGITWLAEVISWEEGTCEAWIFTDIINSLQGVSIFLIFICKRNLLKKIRTKWEPYLRHVKEVVGSKRLSHSKFSTSATGNTAREQLSFSSSENRPNHSAASNRTVQSQLSFDPSSNNRKISTTSLNSTTGVQVHTQNSMPMDTIAESTSPEVDQNQISKDFVALPMETVIDGNEQDKGENKIENYNLTEKAKVNDEECLDNKEKPASIDDNSDTQTCHKLNQNHDSQESNKEIEEDIEELGKSTKDSKRDFGNGEHGSTIEDSSLLVSNKKEEAEMVDKAEYPYLPSQENPAFTGDNDEPIHV